MGSSLVQTPVNKINSEFVEKATAIIDLIYAHLEADPKCEHCQALLNSKNAVVTSHSSRTSSRTGDLGGDPKSTVR